VRFLLSLLKPLLFQTYHGGSLKKMFQLTSFDGNFQLNGEDTFLRVGEYHYFRVPPSDWERDLRLLKEDGKFNAISLTVPWIFHEPTEDEFDFTGRTHPRRDLCSLLTYCQELSLAVILKPGPLIYAEYRGSGLPLWISEQYPEVLAHRSDGSPAQGLYHFNVCYNHPTFLSLVEKWYQALVDQLGSFFDRPIIIFQLDNKTGLTYNFTLGQLDFNPYTINAFHNWLEVTFGDPATLSVYCCESFLSFEEFTPPSDEANPAKAMIWQSFLEDWIVQYLEHLKEIAMRLGVPALFSHNEQGTFFSPANPEKKSPLVEIYGFELSLKTSRSKAILDNPFGNSIIPTIFKTYLRPEYQPLFASEMSCGWFDPRTEVKPIATVQQMIGTIAHGVKGINLYIVRDGEDLSGAKYYFNSLIDHRGRPRKRFDAVKNIHQFLIDYEEELLATEEIYDEIAYIPYALNHRVMPGDLENSHEVIRPLKIIMILAEYGVLGILFASGYNPEPLSLEEVSTKKLRDFKVLFFHNRGAIVQDHFNKLVKYVKKGGHLINGPNFPVMNEKGFPINTQELYPAIVSKQHIYGWLSNFFRSLLARIRLWYQHRRLQKYNIYALPRIERFELLNLLRSWAPKGPSAETLEDVGRVKVDYFAQEFTWQETGVEPLILLDNEAIGYRYYLGKGTNSVIGTPLGARFVIESFYNQDQEKERNKTFINQLLEGYGVKKTFETSVEIEVVGRTHERNKSLFLFLLNRGKRKEGKLKILQPEKTHLPAEKQLTVEIVYCFANSKIPLEQTTLEELTTEGLPFTLAENDSLVLRISPVNE
jgi:beta-galactosidase